MTLHNSDLKSIGIVGRSAASATLLGLIGAVGLLSGSSALAEPSIYPTGTTIYDPGAAYNCYVVFAGADGSTHMIDMDGNDVHHWNKTGMPSELLDPAITGGKKGELLVDDPAPINPSTVSAAHEMPNLTFVVPPDVTIGTLDWNGKVVWQWGGAQAPGGASRQNHDWDRLPNGDILIVATANRIVPSLSKNKISDQAIYEINSKGNIIWKWYAADHIPEYGITPEGMKGLLRFLKNGNRGYGFLTINAMHAIGHNKWYDKGDKRFDPDNIVIDSREANFLAIINKKTGNIVWRVGPDYSTDQGPELRPYLSNEVPRPIDQTAGQHDVHFIPQGLPGAGDILVFDNEGASGFPPARLNLFVGSRVLEINPETKKIVWQYSSFNSNSPPWKFFSSYISSAQRLPNGNTLIDEGMNGRFFQVAPAGKIVWEYVSPYFAQEPFPGGAALTNNSYRAQAVPYDWVPEGTPHSENPVSAVDISKFRVPESQ